MNCFIIKTDLTKKPGDPNYAFVLKRYTLDPAGVADARDSIPSENIEYSFSVGYISNNKGIPYYTKNDLVLQLDFKIDGYWISGLTDTYREKPSRFGVSVATPKNVSYSFDCNKI